MTQETPLPAGAVGRPSARDLVALIDRGGIPFPMKLEASQCRTEIRVTTPQRLAFGFSAAGTRVQASGRIAPDGLQIFLEADIGALPYSAESPRARAAAVELMRAPPPGRIARLNNERRIVLGGNVAVDAPLTPIGIVAALTHWVIEMRPWLVAIATPLAEALVERRRRASVSSAAG